MKVRIVARKNIIGAATGNRVSDNELEYFNGILRGPVHEVDKISDELKEEMIAEFKRLNPTFHNPEYELVVEK